MVKNEEDDINDRKRDRSHAQWYANYEDEYGQGPSHPFRQSILRLIQKDTRDEVRHEVHDYDRKAYEDAKECAKFFISHFVQVSTGKLRV